MNLIQFTGTSAFDHAYQVMMERDAHACGSVDRVLASTMVCLCRQTAYYLYTSFTPLEVQYVPGTRPKLETILNSFYPCGSDPEERLTAIIKFTSKLGDNAEQDLKKIRIGGTEEEIIERGSDWCTDVARVACVLCQIAGIPCRIVNLFDLDKAYSGHVIVEAYRAGIWGAVDSSTGVIYRKHGGCPARVWDLMNDTKLVEAHSCPDAWYTSVGQFRAAGIANYFCWGRDRYDYTITGLNWYYFSILKMSERDWPGGLRWLFGEDGGQKVFDDLFSR